MTFSPLSGSRPSSRGPASPPPLRAELAGEAAFGIVGAADERAEPPKLEVEPSLGAGRAFARIAAIGIRREDVRRQHGVERVDNLRDPQILRLADGGREILPEIAQQLFPGERSGGDFVQPLFQIGGEIVFHVLLEEVHQEDGDDAALVLGNEAAAVHAHIVAVAQHRKDRGIGRGPADAEFFQPLDEARFAVARRRLGEMLLRLHLVDGEGIVLLHLRQAGAVFVGFVVLAFLVDGEEAVEQRDRAGCAQRDLAVGRRPRRRSCAPSRRFPSGLRSRVSRRGRRVWPGRHRACGAGFPAAAQSWWGGSLHALPARSSPCWYRRAARSERRSGRTCCRWCGGLRRSLRRPSARRRCAYR